MKLAESKNILLQGIYNSSYQLLSEDNHFDDSISATNFYELIN
jgi:hypothetical protein